MTPVVYVRHSPTRSPSPDIYMRCPSTYQLMPIYGHMFKPPLKDGVIKADMGARLFDTQHVNNHFHDENTIFPINR